MLEPPVEVEALKAMLALASPAVATTLLGALGTVAGITETVPEAVPLPAALVALTEQL
jgi:hypothetical protein